MTDASLVDAVADVLSKLPPSQEITLRGLFGIGEEKRSAKAIGERFKRTDSCIYVWRKKALRRLRLPIRGRGETISVPEGCKDLTAKGQP